MVRDRTDSFTTFATEELLQSVAAKLQERNIEALVVDNGEEARKLVLERLPTWKQRCDACENTCSSGRIPKCAKRYPPDRLWARP